MMRPPVQQPQDGGSDPNAKDKKDISSKKVNQTLGTIHGNIARLLKDKKFRNAYTLNYNPIQKMIGK